LKEVMRDARSESRAPLAPPRERPASERGEWVGRRVDRPLARSCGRGV